LTGASLCDKLTSLIPFTPFWREKMKRTLTTEIPVKKEVRYSYLSRQFQDPEPFFDVMRSVIRSGQYTLGEELQKFEKALSQICGTKFAVGVASGTDALFLAMKACGIGPGDEVITAPNSFIATAGAIVMTGARPVFVDVREDYTLNPRLIGEKITSKTKAIVPVHLTGNPAEMDAILKIASQRKLLVIEDAAQAISATYQGKAVGSFGIAGCFSFHPLKNLNGWGDGGAITTNSQDLFDKLILLRNHGLRNRDEVALFGYNSRLDTLQAALLLKLMEGVKTVTEKRISWANLYDRRLSELKEFVTVPPRRKEVRQVYHTYVIQVKSRDKLQRFLTEHGVETKVHYPIPLHLQEAARSYGYKKGDFPVCESQAQNILTLPIHQYLEEEDVQYACDQIKEFYLNFHRT